jgi:hypothetical protein
LVTSHLFTLEQMCFCLISGFCHGVNEIFALLGCHAVWIGR